MGNNPAQKEKAAKKAGATETKKVSSKTKAKTTKKVEAKGHANPPERSARKCKMTSCKREYRAKGYCGMHYKKWRNGAFGRARYKTCSDIGCLKPMVTNRHGYCEVHFQNYYVKGMTVSKPAPAAATAPAKEEKKESAA